MLKNNSNGKNQIMMERYGNKRSRTLIQKQYSPNPHSLYWPNEELDLKPDLKSA
jgi:hypothetical protein